MSGLVYFNGILIPEREVVLPITDRGYLYGEGLFETMKATRGFIPFLQEHLRRLYQGVQTLQIPFEVSSAKLEFTLYQTLFHNRLKEAYIRLNLSRENRELGSLEAGTKTHLLVVAKPLRKVPDKLYEEGGSARVSSRFRILPDELSQVKTSNYLRSLLAKQEARRQGAFEAILLNTHGRVADGASSNIFLHNGSGWVTPSLEEGILPGIIRGVLFDMMRKNGISIQERAVELSELQEAQEVLLTNAIQEILPLTYLNDRPIHGGSVGPETHQLMDLFKDEIQYRYEQFESKTWGAKESG